jgi:hypothetical protein
MWAVAVSLLATLVLPVQAAAQDNPSPTYHMHQKYDLIDMIIFGGPTIKLGGYS